MTLRPYSARPARLTLQIAADVFVVVWIYAWYRIGTLVHGTLVTMAEIGYRVDRNAGSIGRNLQSAGRNAANLPLVGDQLGAPLRSAAGQVEALAGSGRTAGDTLAGLATPLGWLVALAPILVVIAIWLPLRLRFARRARMSAELSTAPAGVELLALRALTNRPLHELQRVAADPLRAWRANDPDAVSALARLELEAAGVPVTQLPARSAQVTRGA